MVDKKESSLILFDQTVETDGHKIRFYIDASSFSTIARRYAMALMSSRGIPANDRTLDPVSDLAAEIRERFPGLTNPQQIQDIADSYWETHRETAISEGSIMAFLASKENVFPNEPVPYEDDDSDQLPGLVSLPAPKRDLRNPTEYRLKQIFDFFSTPERISLFTSITDQCWMALSDFKQSVEAQEGNFRRKRTR